MNNTQKMTPPASTAASYTNLQNACRAMVSAQHAGPITPEMQKAWDAGLKAVESSDTAQAVSNIRMMQEALKEAENELCSLGMLLTDEGWETWTIKLTLDLVRIALYGGDGDGQGPEQFEMALEALKTQRDKEEDARAEVETALADESVAWVLVKSPITEEQHRAAVKVLIRANGVDGLPQRMLDAMVVTAPAPAKVEQLVAHRITSEWRNAVKELMDAGKDDEYKGLDAPGHRHRVPGIWDRTGKPCDWCTAWIRLRAMLA
ncbi:hypothetical protein [Chromobacterium haemolyticum]|uniref:Uncharacterized protein n=1 Tax=Chromobacterium haemolyticum TaxID=394935 RepID=A0A1W0CCR2_9NEIS|nr:hypothetical protein [Chromobacterium haemolyticum]OQS32482.1 hypothetical protein B0T45_21760 [Chromobacterium haemolyticum]